MEKKKLIVCMSLALLIVVAASVAVMACEGPPGGGDSTTPDGPTVSITAPADQSMVSGTTTISAAVTSSDDTVKVTGVEIYIDDTLVATLTETPYDYSWDTTAAVNGSHTIYAKANLEGKDPVTSATITVTVSN